MKIYETNVVDSYAKIHMDLPHEIDGWFPFFQGPETSRMVEAKITVFHVCNCFILFYLEVQLRIRG